jgi:hypothetical protein
MYTTMPLTWRDRAQLRAWRAIDHLDTHDVPARLRRALSTLGDVLQALYVVALWALFLAAFVAAVPAT